jgi:dTDP-4-dehydrorhamnose reductase
MFWENSKMTNIILGFGQLGKEIVSQTGWDYISRKRDKFDFTDINTYITKIYKYEIIINCVANTDTYSPIREDHWNTNYLGVILLADYCARTRRKLVQISTDYIYSGSISDATESDVPVHNRCWYAYTKLLADGYIQAALPVRNYLIIRTSFKPKPFPYPKAIQTQYGNFDYTDVIVGYIIELINKEACGVFNVGTETKTIYELAIKTKSNVILSAGVLDPNMPENITMNTNKMKEFLEEKI